LSFLFNKFVKRKDMLRRFQYGDKILGIMLDGYPATQPTIAGQPQRVWQVYKFLINQLRVKV